MAPIGGVSAFLGDAVDSFAGMDVRLALLALAFQLGSLGCRALAWRNVLAAAYPDRRVSAVDVGGAFVAGVALNGYLPGRGGEAAKALLVRSRIPGSTIPTIVSSMSVVLLFDGLVSVSLLVAGWAFGLLPHVPGIAAIPSLAASAGDHLEIVAPAALLIGLSSWLLVRLAGRGMRSVRAGLGQGVAILRQPARYLRTVVLVQLAAWCCRIGVVYFLLAAFHVPAGLPVAALVVVVGGLSTTVSVTPGGAGPQQALHAYTLAGTATAGAAVSFSIGMQVAATFVNTMVGIIGAMVLFRTVRPGAAIRSALRLARSPERAA